MTAMTPAPERRWFRFSLRTLFVVVTAFAVPLGWLTWTWGKVQERERLIQFFLESDDALSGSRRTLLLQHRMGAEPPWLWRRIGATHVYGNILREVRMSDEELDRLKGRVQAVLPDYELTMIRQKP